MHPFRLTLPEWQKYFVEQGEQQFRAKQVFLWIHQKMARHPEEMKNLPNSLRVSLERDFSWPSDAEGNLTESSRDETAKVLFDFSQKTVETVWLPYDSRQSVCVSVQSGCSLNCSFCATGKMKFGGNLDAGEILDQIYSMQRQLGRKVTNVVYMGMGEPFYNYDEVMRSAEILHDEQGLNLGSRRITISTSGVLPGVERFLEENQPFQLALSLHAVFPDKRARLMDIEKRYPFRDVLSVIKKHRRQLRKNQLTFEYILIKGINMGKDDSEELAKLAVSHNAKVNLIPLNTSYNGMERPTEEEIDDFREALTKRGVVAINRRSAGSDIDGACGMLAGKSR